MVIGTDGEHQVPKVVSAGTEKKFTMWHLVRGNSEHTSRLLADPV
jgi:hypothetical protein